MRFLTYVMATIPYKYVRAGHKWKDYFEANDIHKWQFGLERGKGGLRHWQLRFKPRGIETKEGRTNFFNAWKLQFPQAHIEFTENWSDYETKEGFYLTSDDRDDTIKIRFGACNKLQKSWVDWLHNQSDREIDVFYDRQGNHGKTWLGLHLWEKGQAYMVPRYACTAQTISAFICSTYRRHGWRPIIIIDIPRSAKINPNLYEAIEEIKDGLVQDPRYEAKETNIRGVKVMIFTNTKLDTKKLSKDRWRLHGVGVSLP